MSYLYLPASRNVLGGRTVTSTAGTPDSGYPVSWLTDLRPSFPVRYPAGAWGLSVSVASQAVSLVVLANHSIDAPVTVGGTISGTITPATAPVNSILLNPYLLLGAAVPAVTSITFNGTNAGVLNIGEAFAGDPLTLNSLQLADAGDEFLDNGPNDLQGEWRNIPRHDDGVEWRRWSGTQVYTLAEFAVLQSGWEDQRANSRPSVLILDSTVNDARIVFIEKVSYKFNDSPGYVKVSLGFLEYPRYRW